MIENFMDEVEFSDSYLDFRKEGKGHGVIFVCVFGSQLHGTATPQSDIDVKVVFMEDVNSLILKKDRDTIKNEDAVSSAGADVEFDYIELRKFIEDAVKGQTYAVEMLFVNEANTLYKNEVWEDLVSKRDRLITQNVKPFIGYCVSQAKRYGMKGKRLAATQKALKELQNVSPKTRLVDCVDSITKNKHVKVVEQTLSGQTEPIKLLEVNGKKFNFQVKVGDVLPVVQSVVDKYGARARRAVEGNDWKAIGHAYRCAYELEELLTTGKISFPLKDRDELLSIKKGEVPYEEIQEELPVIVEDLKQLDSDLPEGPPDEIFWEGWTLNKYRDKYGV